MELEYPENVKNSLNGIYYRFSENMDKITFPGHMETSQVLLADVSGGFPGVLPFRPTYTDWPVSMSEIILKGTLN